jgi:ABC-type antimicrobial peptide transport system permease subunit
MEIVGVVAHVKQWGLDSDDQSTVRAQMYTPVLQLPDEALGVGINVLARFQGLPTATLNELERSNASISSEQVLYGAQTMDEIVATSLAQQRFSMILLGTFAALALLLASVGVYGVMSFTVGQRTREIGIRLALGAGRSEILRLVLAGGGKLILIGVGLGFVAALGLMRFMAAQLYGVSAADPLTFAAVAALLSAVALLACYIPARRASRVNPLVALHQE